MVQYLFIHLKSGNLTLIEGVNDEKVSGRIRHIGSIYIESSEGERFKYPYKHLNGARAMARHVAEGGNAYDDFGKHIVSLSEEMAKLRKFIAKLKKTFAFLVFLNC